MVRLLLDLHTTEMRNMVEHSDWDIAGSIARHDRLDSRGWFDLGLERLGSDSDRGFVAVPAFHVDRMVVPQPVC